jgi:hypothetical protein
VQVGSAVFPAENAFAAPGSVAVDAVQFRLGDGTGVPTATNASLSVSINGQPSNTVLLPVQ